MMKGNDVLKGIGLFCLLLIGTSVSAQAIYTPSEPAGLERSFWSLSIQDAETGEVLVGIRDHHLMTPASTMKLVSTAALWSQKGGAGRIPTEIRTNGRLENGKVEGDIYIVGQGDPSIGSRYFWNRDQDVFFKQVAQGLKAKGITEISGDVIAIVPRSDFQANNPKWLAYDMGNAYAAGLWELNAYDNSYSIHFTENGRGFSVEPEIPELKLTKMYDITSTRGRDSIYISPFVLPDGSYPITGAYPANIAKLQVRGAMPNPPLFIAHRLRSFLNKQGVPVSGKATTAETMKGRGELLYTFESPSIRELMEITLVYSHNLFAEGMLRQLAIGKTPLPGHSPTQTAIEEVKSYWKGRGLDTDELEMVDGSGLSTQDRVTTHFLAAMLGKVYRADKSGVYMRLLPRAGMDGTLTIFLKNTPLQGKARLKSGTLRNVVCYAGYVELGGKTYTVALMVNNFYGSASTIRKAMEQVLLESFGLR
ncbi:D-alanyl-D-alanine carboxypeptidase/D-alanyl-D-alanine endopeptidase [Porphyromonas levii]|uniref:D-alanyl-D-alanine carboxypeptidase/D-alanyl-D-alanine endopeptidase n=1 Tax=Porphyromonas levii TaxID=28114 RepID=UPI001BAA1DE3|nr:D-alanyl-D-alanine carboxypeptidase/D-alanyl-D-alanine-endopeptidase [Porphyromonas levii]MBR8802238.1 D-alanyl-D-alanine carboxypeptidase DacC [Porphyromonas levii]